MIPVNEIFGATIQGEGPEAGKKCIFVRVAGCDYRCVWCDSARAWEVDKDTPRYEPEDLAQELVNRCISTNTNTIILTGGNPCLYDFSDVIVLVKKELPYVTFSVETQGTKFPEWLKYVRTIVISPKGPSSGQKDVFDNVKNFIDNFTSSTFDTSTIALKFVIFNKEDLEFAKRYYKILKDQDFVLVNQDVHLGGIILPIDLKFYLSVGNDDVNEKGSISERILSNYHKVIDMIMEDEEMENVYVLPQIHTLVWGNKAGV